MRFLFQINWYFLIVFGAFALFPCNTEELIGQKILKTPSYQLREQDVGIMVAKNEKVTTSIKQYILETLPTPFDVNNRYIKHIDGNIH